MVDLCQLLHWGTVETAQEFVTSTHPERYGVTADGVALVDEDGTWNVVALVGGSIHADRVRWLQAVVFPTLRRQVFEHTQSPNSPVVRELWHIYNELADSRRIAPIADGRTFAIDPAEFRVAAMAHGYEVPDQRTFNQILRSSRESVFAGNTSIERSGRRFGCMAFATAPRAYDSRILLRSILN